MCPQSVSTSGGGWWHGLLPAALHCACYPVVPKLSPCVTLYPCAATPGPAPAPQERPVPHSGAGHRLLWQGRAACRAAGIAAAGRRGGGVHSDAGGGCLLMVTRMWCEQEEQLPRLQASACGCCPWEQSAEQREVGGVGVYKTPEDLGMGWGGVHQHPSLCRTVSSAIFRSRMRATECHECGYGGVSHTKITCRVLKYSAAKQ